MGADCGHSGLKRRSPKGNHLPILRGISSDLLHIMVGSMHSGYCQFGLCHITGLTGFNITVGTVGGAVEIGERPYEKLLIKGSNETIQSVGARATIMG